MKTEIISQKLLNNYNVLSEMAKVPQTKQCYVPTWGIVYKKGAVKGLVCQEGMIERNGIKLNVLKGKTLKIIEKPFYMTQSMVLKKINGMLEKIINNYDNDKVVEKNVLNILCFPKELMQKIGELACKM